MITSKKLRESWLNFYKEKGHLDIGAVSLIGDGTTGVMFNVSHFTFFEMMGNWSLGDYFKKEKTAWSFEFLTKVLGFDGNKICSTVFAGNENAPRDEEAVKCLVNAGVKKENIYYLEDNWWDLPGTVNTPCGPDNEWFYPRWDTPCSDHCDVTCECGRWVEIGNDVYMQYKKLDGGKYDTLKNKNIELFDLERINNSNLEVISSTRVINLIKEALNHINNALNNVSKSIPVDMIAIDIKAAWDALGEITGESYQDELLDTLFSKFCLGK